jgi:hypothetical protein
MNKQNPKGNMLYGSSHNSQNDKTMKTEKRGGYQEMGQGQGSKENQHGDKAVFVFNLDCGHGY